MPNLREVKGVSGEKDSAAPRVVIYGDSEDRAATKLVWALLGHRDLKIDNISTMPALVEKAPGAVLIMVVVATADDPQRLAVRDLAHTSNVVADTIAVMDEAPLEDRIKVLALGFDLVINRAVMSNPDFQQVLLNKIEKGRLRQKNRVQREEYRRFQAALSASPDAFIVFDNDRKLFFLSEHYRRAYPVRGSLLTRGLDVMEAFRMLSEEQGVLPGDPRYDEMKEFWETLYGQKEFVMADGRIWRIRAAKLAENQGTIVTTTDITDYMRTQQEIEKKSCELAEALDKEKESGDLQRQFINMVSHEFRTPLSIIDGTAQVLDKQADRMDAETLRKRCRTIRSAVTRLVHMMEGILSSSMLRTGKMELMPEDMDLREAIGELAGDHMELARQHKITIDCAGLPEAVFLDRKVVTLVLGNLISNAVKYTKDQPDIKIRAWQEDGFIKICIQDNGIGIPEGELGKIFERFYRASTASGIPGTGIGLSLVRELVELHGGTASVESRVKKGTSVTVSFPAARTVRV